MRITNPQMGPEPFDRLTELTVEMAKPLETAENADVKGMIFLQDRERGGIQMFGYSDASEAMAALLLHMKAIFNAQGKSFGVMTEDGVMIVPEEMP